VATVAIMGRLEGVEFLFIMVRFFGDRWNYWIVGNAVLVLLGVLVAIIEPRFEGKPIPASIGCVKRPPLFGRESMYLCRNGYHTHSFRVIRHRVCAATIGFWAMPCWCESW
jgi:hypothetical protein